MLRRASGSLRSTSSATTLRVVRQGAPLRSLLYSIGAGGRFFSLRVFRVSKLFLLSVFACAVFFAFLLWGKTFLRRRLPITRFPRQMFRLFSNSRTWKQFHRETQNTRISTLKSNLRTHTDKHTINNLLVPHRMGTSWVKSQYFLHASLGSDFTIGSKHGKPIIHDVVGVESAVFERRNTKLHFFLSFTVVSPPH